GQKVTALGGFVYDATTYTGIGGDVVRVFNSAPPNGAGTFAGPCSLLYAQSGAVAQDTTTPMDGFWFVWRMGPDQASGTTPLASGLQYTVVVCDATGERTTFTLLNKLGNKEFNEVDFRY